MKRMHLRLLYWIPALALLPFAGLAQPIDMVVATDGTVHKLVSGTYPQLFPEGSEADAESSVLALEIRHSGTIERLLVPTTEDLYAEVPAALHYEKRSNTTYVLWEGLVSGLHPFLHLAGFDGEDWSEPISITGNVFAEKGRADLVIVPEPEVNKSSALLKSAVDRSVIYVTWLEENPSGSDKYLVPLILQGGVYLGWHDSIRLSWLAVDSEVGNPRSRPAVDADVASLLRIQPSARGNAVVIGFTNSTTGRLVTLEVELLPQALSALASRVSDLILQNAELSSSVAELAESVRAGMMEFGEDFHPGMLDYLADEIEALIREHPTVVAAVAPGIPEKLGVHIMDLGSRVRSKGLIDSAPTHIIQIGQTRQGGGPYHHLKVSVLADREPPEVSGPAVLFLSSTGLEALVAWEEKEGIAFRETEGADWGDRQVVSLSDDLTKQEVYRILADRTLNR